MGSLRDTVSSYLQAAGDWARGTTAADGPATESGGYTGPLPAVPGRFRILELLGQGGMGVVYRAYDAELEREVALKSLRSWASSDMYHLKQEFRTRAELQHPNLVELYELHADRRGCFFTMELLRGTDLVQHVRDGQGAPPDLEKLRACARQLASAIAAVHAVGKLHRDIKPTNVMITRGGRAVLLDFGLAVDLAPHGAPFLGTGAAGTALYMSPEQAAGMPLSEASDWYSFGVTLYEAAVGLAPRRSSFETTMGSFARHERDLGKLADAPDLQALIDGLVQPDPQQRPSGDEVLRRLGGNLDVRKRPVRPLDRPDLSLFVNREQELAVFETALRAVGQGATRILALEGPSGIGKSELARICVERAQRAGAIVLRAKCHPRESVTFNAVDGMIDDLSQLLDQAPDQLVPEIASEHMESLLRLFPVLRRVRAFRRSPGVTQGAALYSVGFSTLRELLAKVAASAPLILWIDDAQWGDVDSGKLLRDLLRPPGQPALLLLLTYRRDEAEPGGALETLLEGDGALPAAWLSRLALGPLSVQRSRELARRLIGEHAEAHSGGLDDWVDQAGGHPFFVRELVRHISILAEEQRPIGTQLELAHVLGERLASLEPETRAILEIAANAGTRLQERVLLRAAGLDWSAVHRIYALERAHLLRVVKTSDGTQSEVYHQLIRARVLEGLSASQRSTLHRAVGDAMVATGNPNLVRAVEQYEAAGALDQVRCYVVGAAARAANAFAFDQAVHLYQRAYELGGTELPDAELLRRIGDNYTDLGRGNEAGLAYQKAAELAAATGLDEQAVVLSGQAAEQLLQAGRLSAGLELIKRTLREHELDFPRGPRGAMLMLLRYRALLGLRGIGFTQRRASELAPVTLHRLDVLYMVSRTWSLVEHMTGTAFGAQFLYEALQVGEPRRIAIALTCEAVALSTTPGRLFWKRVDRFLDVAQQLAEEDPDPAMFAGLRACRGMVGWFRGELRAACADLDRAVESFQGIRRHTLSVSLAHTFRLPSLALLGQLKRLRRELELTQQDAERRNDRFYLRMTRSGHCSLAWITQGQLETALALADQSRADTSLDGTDPGYSTQHYWHLLTSVHVELYRGTPELAWQRVESEWPLLKKNNFLLLSFNRDDLRHARARVALALARQLAVGSPTLPARARRLVAEAEREARELEHHGVGPSRAWAALVRAAASQLQARPERAVLELKAAIDALSSQGLELYVACAQHVLGAQLSGAEGAALREQAATFMRAQEVVDPDATARMLVPGF